MSTSVQRYILIVLTGVFCIGAFLSLLHGLPFYLVGDEESIIGGTLQMLSQKVLFPVQNRSAFEFLYYPIALPYSILALVVPYAIGILIFNPAVSGIESLGHYLLVNLDQVWILARLVSVFMGVLAVYFTHKLARVVFPKQPYIGLFAALFILTSFFHFQLSVVMRHWMFSTVMFIASLYFLFKSYFNIKSDALRSGFFVALASGFGQIGLITSFFVGISYLAMNRTKEWFGLKNKNFWLFSALAVGGFLFFLLTHPDAFNFILAGEETNTLAEKSLNYYFYEFKNTIIFLLHHEFVISILGLLGAILMVVQKKIKEALLFTGIIILHNIFLFTFFHNAPRYQWYIIPLLAVMGAYLLSQFWLYMNTTRIKHTIGIMAIAVVFLIPTLGVVQYAKLLSRPTTEQMAYKWLQERIEDDVIMIHSRSITPLQEDTFVAIQDEYGRSKSRDNALLGIDTAKYGKKKIKYNNTYFWDGERKSELDIQEFIKKYNPKYIVWSYDNMKELNTINELYGDISNYSTVYKEESTLTDPRFGAFSDFGILNRLLWSTPRLGQNIEIYQR